MFVIAEMFNADYLFDAQCTSCVVAVEVCGCTV